MTSSKRFAALPSWLAFAIALSAFSVSVFSICLRLCQFRLRQILPSSLSLTPRSALPNPPFPRLRSGHRLFQPPDPVKPSFNEVNQAQQEREKLINQAQSEYNRIIPRARGEAQQTIQEARGYALDRINRARGDSARFAAVYDAYRKAPEVTRTRIYLETMTTILPQVSRKIIVDEKISGLLPLLNLGDALQRKEGD